MTFNPDIHHRRSIRLRHYDYASDGAYFLTLCTFDRGCYFDQFPQLKEIVDHEWNHIPSRFPAVALDEYVIMPNHFHGIIIIRRDTPCGYPQSVKPGHPQEDAPTLGNIVGAFKSLCVTSWLKAIQTENINASGKFWQHNYYEHIIRNDDEMNRIRQYINDNPIQWALDRENPVSGNQQQKQIEKWMI